MSVAAMFAGAGPQTANVNPADAYGVESPDQLSQEGSKIPKNLCCFSFHDYPEGIWFVIQAACSQPTRTRGDLSAPRLQSFLSGVIITNFPETWVITGMSKNVQRYVTATAAPLLSGVFAPQPQEGIQDKNDQISCFSLQLGTLRALC